MQVHGADHDRIQVAVVELARPRDEEVRVAGVGGRGSRPLRRKAAVDAQADALSAIAPEPFGFREGMLTQGQKGRERGADIDREHEGENRAGRTDSRLGCKILVHGAAPRRTPRKHHRHMRHGALPSCVETSDRDQTVSTWDADRCAGARGRLRSATPKA